MDAWQAHNIPKEKPRDMSLRAASYPDEIAYVYEVAKARGIKSKSNVLALIIREHKQAKSLPNDNQDLT